MLLAAPPHWPSKVTSYVSYGPYITVVSTLFSILPNIAPIYHIVVSISFSILPNIAPIYHIVVSMFLSITVGYTHGTKSELRWSPCSFRTPVSLLLRVAVAVERTAIAPVLTWAVKATEAQVTLELEVWPPQAFQGECRDP